MFEILIGLFLFALGAWLFISGTVANVRVSIQKRQISELAEKNAKLEASLRRLQLDLRTELQNIRAGSPPKNEVLTLTAETESSSTAAVSEPDKTKQSAKPANGGFMPPPAKPAVPVAPFIVPPPKPEPSEKQDSGLRTPSGWTRSAFAADAAFSPAAATSEPLKKPLKDAFSAVKRPPSQSLELWIGRKLFGWVAIAGFIVAAAILIRHAVNSGWIGHEFKVAGITLFGFALLGLGYHFHRTGLRRFSTMLSGGGIILVFQAGYASFGIYKLIPLSVANAVLPLIVVGGFLLAWFYRSKLLGTISITGGLAVPLLLAAENTNEIQFFAYLLLLNAGTVLLVNLLRRVPIAFLAFFGTQALCWDWYREHDQSRTNYAVYVVLLFQLAFYAVYFADTTIAAAITVTKKIVPTWDDAMRAVLAPIILFGSLFFLSLRYQEDSYLLLYYLLLYDDSVFPVRTVLHETLGYFAFIGAAWYALLSVLYARRFARVWNAEVAASLIRYWKAAPAAALVMAFGFIAVGIPLQFYAEWIALGWMTVFAGLWFSGHYLQVRTFMNMSCVFFGLGSIRLVFDVVRQLPVTDHLELAPLWNPAMLPILAAAGLLMFASVAARAFIREYPFTDAPVLPQR